MVRVSFCSSIQASPGDQNVAPSSSFFFMGDMPGDLAMIKSCAALFKRNRQLCQCFVSSRIIFEGLISCAWKGANKYYFFMFSLALVKPT